MAEEKENEAKLNEAAQAAAIQDEQAASAAIATALTEENNHTDNETDVDKKI